jgi:threonine/homoserine/homoserine lactone efflux protein
VHPEQLVAFVAIAITVVVIPGPDMALVARNVVLHGRRAGYATSLGIVTGTLAWGLAAAVGVAAILAASATLFTILKLAGAGYLVYLGLKTLFDGSHALGGDPGANPGPPIGAPKAFAQGALSAMLNPKLGVFFLTLLPQFITPGPAFAAGALQLTVLFDLIGLTWLALYTTLLAAVRSVLARPRPRKVVRAVTGTVLVAFGARVALER